MMPGMMHWMKRRETMSGQHGFRLSIDEPLDAIDLPDRPEEPSGEIAVGSVSDPRATVRALLATPGAQELVAKIPNLGAPEFYGQIASFSVCKKTGSARYLDIWDADHFDGFTDMQRCVADCRAWFSAGGFTTWGAPQTKSGRINCYFRVPARGNYVCEAYLQSYGGPATVQCLTDSQNHGLLGVSGTIQQAHHANLAAGWHHFRIRQVEGAFFFLGLVVWHIPVIAT